MNEKHFKKLQKIRDILLRHVSKDSEIIDAVTDLNIIIQEMEAL